MSHGIAARLRLMGAPCRSTHTSVEGGVRRRIAAVLTAASFVGFAAWEMTRDVHPWADLSNGFFPDPLSHMNDARHFPRAGIRHWTTPLARMEPRLTPAQRAGLPRDIV